MPTVRLVRHEYRHHSEIEPVEQVGPWCVYTEPAPAVFLWCPTTDTQGLIALRVKQADWVPEEPVPRDLPPERTLPRTIIPRTP